MPSFSSKAVYSLYSLYDTYTTFLIILEFKKWKLEIYENIKYILFL